MKHKCNNCNNEVDLPARSLFDGYSKTLYQTMLDNVICELCGSLASMKKELPREIYMKNLKRSGIPIPLTYWDESLGNTVLLDFIWRNQHKSLFIPGKTGTCKTRCVISAASRIMWADPSIRIQYHSAIELRKKASHAQKEEREYKKFMENLFVCDFLILDDLGKSTATPASREFFFDLIDRCNTHKKRIWITTEDNGDGIRGFMGVQHGDAFVRRLKDMCFCYNPNKIK